MIQTRTPADAMRRRVLLCAVMGQGLRGRPSRGAGNHVAARKVPFGMKKPAGAKPGMVVYTTYNTVLADPSAELMKRLAVK